MNEIITDHGTFGSLSELNAHMADAHQTAGPPTTVARLHAEQHRAGAADHDHPRRTDTRARARAVKDAARWLQGFLDDVPYATCLQVVRDRRNDLLPDDGGVTFADLCRYPGGVPDAGPLPLSDVAVQVVDDICDVDVPADPAVVAMLLALDGFDVYVDLHGPDREVVLGWPDTSVVADASDWSTLQTDDGPVTLDVPAGCPDPTRVAGAITTALAPSGSDDVFTLPVPAGQVEQLAVWDGDRSLAVSGWPDGQVTVDNGDTVVWWAVGDGDPYADGDAPDGYERMLTTLQAAVGQRALLCCDGGGVRLDVGDLATVRFVAAPA